MGVEPPFIYDKPSSYTFAGPTHRSFNPKAVTHASWSPPAPKPKRDGPLIDFNKHPDSYLIVPYGNLNVAPMNPKTKGRVKRTRKVQLFLRVLGLLGALGLLFCIIAINKTSTSVGWIIRVGPAVALCHCVYAIYHLCRDVSTRPPASSASYMLFAAMLDTGLIPFFAFSAIMANADYRTNAYGWSTLFANDEINSKIILVFFLTCCVEGGLMAISLVIDIYLATIFRKIAKMPPDMNPLEDNLTARPNPKHKRNKSSLNFEKHLSGSTLATQRMSQMSDGSNFKRVPFTHTRTDSADSITLYGNEKALNSRTSLRNEIREANADPYRYSAATSRDSPSPTRPSSAITPAANARAPGSGLDHKPVRSSMLAQGDDQHPPSWLSYSGHDGTPTKLSNTARQELDGVVRPLSPVSMLSEHDIPVEYRQTERLNWYQGSPRNLAQVDLTQMPLSRSMVSTPDPEEDRVYQDTLTPPAYGPKKRSLDPLGMNPPTPIQNHFQHENVYHTPAQDFSTPQRPALNDMAVNSSSRPGMGSRPSSFIGSGGKSRFYGDLRNSLGGSPTRESFETPMTHPQLDDGSGLYSRTRTMESEESGNFRVYDSEEDDNDSDLEDHQHQLRQDEHSYSKLQHQTDSIMLGLPPHRDQWTDSRKVSNSTGYDLKTGYAGLGAEFGQGMARRREVSGKVAEEGRVGSGYGNIGYSEIRDGAVMTGQAKRNGAAGWARFHGL